jgi:glycosyltransferase involved in cell wall biosynthesis
MKRILFIVKQRNVYSDGGYENFPSGLLNSAQFVADMLDQAGHIAEVVDVVDNNDIDRVVTQFNPDVVIIEALWVVPSKFTILTQLHPKVKWVVRIHSDIPFLAQEGMAVDWLKQYVLLPNVYVATNSMRGLKDLLTITENSPKAALLPNFYPKTDTLPRPKLNGILNVGCFGAIRPFKNQLIQAVAAIRYGDQTGKRILFHVNSSRNETGGRNVLKNLRSLFMNTRHELIENSWMTHDQFIQVVATMDVSLSISFTETFCITAADSVAVGVPIVVSDQVPWANQASIASTTNSDDIVRSIGKAIGWKSGMIVSKNRRGLFAYSANSRKLWIQYLG